MIQSKKWGQAGDGDACTSNGLAAYGRDTLALPMSGPIMQKCRGQKSLCRLWANSHTLTSPYDGVQIVASVCKPQANMRFISVAASLDAGHLPLPLREIIIRLSASGIAPHNFVA
jgi:hypothetical protein